MQDWNWLEKETREGKEVTWTRADVRKEILC